MQRCFDKLQKKSAYTIISVVMVNQRTFKHSWFVLKAFPHVATFLAINISTECLVPWCFHYI